MRSGGGGRSGTVTSRRAGLAGPGLAEHGTTRRLAGIRATENIWPGHRSSSHKIISARNDLGVVSPTYQRAEGFLLGGGDSEGWLKGAPSASAWQCGASAVPCTLAPAWP